MKKYLVATVGEDIPHLVASIQKHDPDEVLLVASSDLTNRKSELTSQTTLTEESIGTFIFKDTKNPVKIADELSNFFIDNVSIQNSEIVVDFTGGEKPMPAGLVLFSQEFERIDLGLMSNVGGTTEESDIYHWRPINFDRLKLKLSLRQAQEAFEDYYFRDSAETLRKAAEFPTIDYEDREIIQDLIQVSIGYDLWDRGLFKKAYETLSGQRTGKYVKNRLSYLNILIDILSFLNPNIDSDVDVEQLNPDPFLLTGELIKSARRRKNQQQYDEAVARVYRAIEMIPQTALKLETGFYTSNFPIEHLPDGADIPTEPDKSFVKLGLIDAFEVYSLISSSEKTSLSNEWRSEKESVKNWIGNRNHSLLAHGFEPIENAEIIEQGLEKSNQLLEAAREDFTTERSFTDVKPDLDQTLICYLQ